MCGGMTASFIYDFLLYPRDDNLRTRMYILRNGRDEENIADETIAGDNNDAGPSQWPKH